MAADESAAQAAKIGEQHVSAPPLARSLGPWDLTAIGVNQIIGATIFLIGSTVAGYLGVYSLVAIWVCGVATLLVALCMAEAGSRFTVTGGPYTFARAAFGPFVGFEIGWMQWFVRVASYASIANGLALTLGIADPWLASGVGRVLVVASVTVVLTVITLSGVRQNANAVNALAIAKLAPLVLFVVIGLFHLNPAGFGAGELPSLRDAAAGALLLIFSLGGVEVVAVPAGEAREPRRHVPFGLVMSVGIATLVLFLVQLVLFGTLPGLTASATPVSDAASKIMGETGSVLMFAGAVVSTVGSMAGGLLAGSRLLFAMAEQRDLPQWFAAVHERTRVPHRAVLASALVVLALGVSGSFVTLAASSALARLLMYIGVCGATLRLRRATPAWVGEPAVRLPGGGLIPWAAIVLSCAILLGITAQQLQAGLLVLGVGALLFVMRRMQGS